ncbi:35181_t:CDS:2, partial [Gigaspora margarita]
TENQKITHNPLQMDQILLDIDTGNTKDIIPVTKEKLTTYTLWDLPRLFNNGQVKRLMGRYGKVQEICWTCEKFSKQAHIILTESKNNPIQQEDAETSSRNKSEIKEKKTTRFIKKDENRTGRKTFELGNYTTMKSKWKHTGKENDNTTENLNTRRMTHKNNLSNENKERSSHPKNESLNATLQEILNRLEKIKSSYSSSRAIVTLDTGQAPTASKVAKGIPKKEGLGGANLKGKEKEHLTDNVGNIIKDRFMRINKAEGSRKMKTSEDYQISKEWAAYIVQASTKDMDLVTNSDHKLFITALNTGINTRFRSHAKTRKKGKRRLVFELEKASENDWVHYKRKLKRLLLSKIHIDKKISIDEEWDIIQSNIIKAAQTFLPIKKKLAEMLKTEDTGKTDVLQLLKKCIRKLGTFCRRIRKKVLIPQKEKELHKLCKDIKNSYEIDTFCKQTQDTEEKRRLKLSGKKATWFKDLETKIISKPLTRKIRQELIKESGKTEVGRISKKRIKNKIKIEHWNRDDDKENSIQKGPKLKRCQSCNDEQKEQSRGCLLQRNFKNNKKAINKKLIGKSNEKGEHELLVSIKLFNFKLSINEVTTEQIKKEPAISYLAIELLEERILKEYIKGKEKIIKKETSQKIAELIKLENMTRSLTETEDIYNLIFGRDREAIVKARLELARDLITEEKRRSLEAHMYKKKHAGNKETRKRRKEMK